MTGRSLVAVWLLLALGLSSVAGCIRVASLLRADNEVYVEELVSVWGSWLEDTGDTFTVRLHVTNLGRGPLLIPAHELACLDGDTWRPVVLRERGAREFLRLAAGASEIITVTCPRGPEVEDSEGFSLLIGHIFEARRGGPRRVLATDIEWRVSKTGVP